MAVAQILAHTSSAPRGLGSRKGLASASPHPQQAKASDFHAAPSVKSRRVSLLPGTHGLLQTSSDVSRNRPLVAPMSSLQTEPSATRGLHSRDSTTVAAASSDSASLALSTEKKNLEVAEPQGDAWTPLVNRAISGNGTLSVISTGASEGQRQKEAAQVLETPLLLGTAAHKGLIQQLLSLPEVPDRYLTVLKASLAFVLANMDKVNLSVAIIPMSHQYGWNASTAGLVQSAFFWGYALSLVPSGWMAQRFTGQRVLKAGVAMWSVATAVVPWCAGSLPLMLGSRFLVGFGEGVAPPAATDLVARTMPASERTRAVSTVFNGFNVGSIIGLLIAPALIDHFGWESVFYLFGVAGILWSAWFNPPPALQDSNSAAGANLESSLQSGNGTDAPCLHSSSLYDGQDVSGFQSSAKVTEEVPGVPWRAILERRAVWALVFIHFCQNWGHFCVLAWLPTFYNEGLHLNLGQSALVSMVPPIMSLLVSAAVAPLADRAVQRGADVTLIRKAAQGAAFLVPALCMGFVACAADLSLPPWAVIALLSLGLSFSSCAYAGLYCAHQDMSTRYASILLGLSTTVGAVPGILGVPLTGVLFDLTHSWMVSLFLPSILFYVSGTVVWSLYGDCRPQHFENELQPQSRY